MERHSLHRPVLAALVAGLALLGPARAAADSSATLVGEVPEGISHGQAHTWRSPGSTVQLIDDPDEIRIHTSSSGVDYDLIFTPPPGETLHTGVYDHATRADSPDPGRPGLDVSGDGRGCGSVSGRFEVRDVSYVDGRIDRLWLVYEQFCAAPEILGDAGEVRINEPTAVPGLSPVPSVVRWPASDAGRPAPTIPVTVFADSAAMLSSASIVGPDAGAFDVVDDGCAGVSLAAGGHCTVSLGFDRSRPGTRQATLRLPSSAGGIEIPLEAFAFGGTTKLEMHSEPGDFVGQGDDWLYTLPTARIGAGRYLDEMRGGASVPLSDWWDVTLAPAPGGSLAPGTYDGAARADYRGSSPGLEVAGNGRGCNTISGRFTVTDATFDLDGQPRTFGSTFEQHCEGAAPALRGEFDFRAGDRTPLPPWMLGGSAVYAPVRKSPDPAADGPGGSVPRGDPALSRCARGAFAGANPITGTRLGELLRGSAGADAVFALGGADRVLAGRGSDCVDGAGGADRLSGGRGADLLIGGRGSDWIRGGPGRDRIDCGPGHDTVRLGPHDRSRRCEHVVRG